MDLFPNGPPAQQPNPDLQARSTHRKQQRGSASWLWRGTKFVVTSPFSAVPYRQIGRGAHLMRDLASSLQRCLQEPRAVPQGRDGKLDMLATAFLHGITEADLEDMLLRRRTYTAAAAYASFALGWLFVALWISRLLNVSWSGGRWLTAIEFAPFCLVFFLTAFKQAHVNWVLRTRTLGTAGDYLRSPAPFWPRP